MPIKAYHFQIQIIVRFPEDFSTNGNCSTHHVINKYFGLNLYFVKGHSVIELENLKKETDMLCHFVRNVDLELHRFWQ